MFATLRFFASCPRGVEPLLWRELEAIGATEVGERRGGVAFSGTPLTARRACLWSRLASRILQPLATFDLVDADSLYNAAREIDWPGLFAPERSFAIDVAGRSPAIAHTRFAALRVKDGIADQFRAQLGFRPDVDTQDPDVRVHVLLERDRATLSLDLSGQSLHRRGWRGAAGEAPLKENLAAAILVRAGWPALAAQGQALMDPMCGSGTLVIEAAWMAADIAPGILRERFGFESLRNHDAASWASLRQEAHGRREAGLARIPPMLGSDGDGRVISIARQNAMRAGLSGRIDWQLADMSTARPIAPHGLLVTNPPYGERLGDEAQIILLHSLLGATLKQHFAGWHAAVFTGRPDLGPRLGLRASSNHSLYNGALPCKLLNFEINAPAAQTSETGDGEPVLAPVAGGEDFANRLRKNLKHLGKWAKRGDIANYRAYDADLPEYALAVDLYHVEDGLHAHVQEYAPPATIDPVKAERRLREALSRLAEVLELPASRLHYKLRKSQKGKDQYLRQDDSGHYTVATEHAARLWVNFDDFLDTGLFLDHRPIRQRIQREARGKRVLNLFCYTGAATVHAAVGGAKQTLSLDLSNTYLDWAGRNLRLNGFESGMTDKGKRYGDDRAPHQLERADCLAWLQDRAESSRPPQFDLIFCDPPTFSNSKRMEGVLDTQRDHAQMILDASRLLAPDGVLYFSTNRRKFKLDEEALASLKLQEITPQTLDEDFKRPPPAHRCWRIMRG